MSFSIEPIVNQVNSQLSTYANNLNSTLSNDTVQNDPQAMLRAQYEMQQYSVGVSFQSSVMKAVKDMMMGVISNIG